MAPSDIRAIGRFGQPLHSSRRSRRRRPSLRRHGAAGVATRRPVVPRSVLAALGVAVLAFTYVGVAAARQLPVGPAAPSALLAATDGERERPDPDAADRSNRSAPAASPAFARMDGLALALPHPDPLVVAFHEASKAEALTLTPVGRLEANDNTARFDPPPDTADGPAYRVLSSRGRGRPATSAVDVAVPNGDVVTAPVTGEVVEVRQYTLYGGVEDWRVVIAPRGRPDLHVVMIHLHRPQVQVGDTVTAGRTTMSLPRLLPFTSHVDYVLDDEQPHVHLEVKAATRATPLDPNAPAVDATERLDVAD
ncbi:MAG: M23 family metallopeptidase [Egibacteraceae bacterium]